MKQITFTWVLDDEDTPSLEVHIEDFINDGMVILTVVPLEYSVLPNGDTVLFKALVITH